MNTPNLEYVACPTSKCGGQWLPSDKVDQLRDSHETFYCPSGHSQWFKGKSEVEKLKAQVADLIASRDYWKKQYYLVSEEKRAERRRRYALKGQITRLKKAS